MFPQNIEINKKQILIILIIKIDNLGISIPFIPYAIPMERESKQIAQTINRDSKYSSHPFGTLANKHIIQKENKSV